MKIIAFGEILWDIFPDKKAIGGAPFNFAAHVSRLGADSAIISAVGDDELGKDALEAVDSLGVDRSFVTTEDAPTGFCAVTLSNGQPQYDLREGVAYDIIRAPEKPLCGDLFYFGTLALRAKNSRLSLETIISRGKFSEILCDLNIRQHYYTDEIIKMSLNACTWLKISDEDAEVFAPMGYDTDAKALCAALSRDFDIKTIIYTRGGDGALIYDRAEDKYYEQSAPKVEVASSVGAGDSFAACYSVSRLSGDTVGDSLAKAIRLSAFVVSRTEAIPQYDESLAELCINK